MKKVEEWKYWQDHYRLDENQTGLNCNNTSFIPMNNKHGKKN